MLGALGAVMGVRQMLEGKRWQVSIFGRGGGDGGRGYVYMPRTTALGGFGASQQGQYWAL